MRKLLGVLLVGALLGVGVVPAPVYAEGDDPPVAAAPDPEPAPEPKAEPAPEPKAEPAPEPKAEPAPEPKPEPAPEPKAEPAPEPEAEPAPEPAKEQKADEQKAVQKVAEIQPQGYESPTPTPTPTGSTPPDDIYTKTVEYCHWSDYYGHYKHLETTIKVFLYEGHLDHAADIWAAFTYVKLGVEHTVDARGDQSVLANDCMTTQTPPALPPPEVKVTYGDWVDGDWKCGDTTVTQTREVVTTTTPYKVIFVYGEYKIVPDLHNVTTTTVVESRTRDLTAEELATCPPVPLVVIVYSDWVDGQWVCGDTTVVQTRTKTVTTTTYIMVNGQWVLDTAHAVVVVTTETGSRALTMDEQLSVCPPQPPPLVVTVFSDWVDGQWACGDTMVPQTRTKTVTTTSYVLMDGEWVLDTAHAQVVVTTETGSRPLTAEEMATCPPAPLVITGFSDWVDSQFVCGDTEVMQTRTKTVTTIPYVLVDGQWVLDTAHAVVVVSTETQTRPLTAEEQLSVCPPQPPPTVVVVTGDWVDSDWVCGDVTVTQTRTVTTTTTPYVLMDGVWVLDTANAMVVVTTETRTRDLTQAEIGTCPLLPGGISAVCVGDVPFLSWNVSLPEGFVQTSPLTITFVHPSDPSQNIVWTGLPLSGTRLWPGASTGDPQMWPGWDIDANGNYFPVGDANFGWTRNGVTVVFEVNPTYTTVVGYPAATETCANPLVAVGGVEDDEGTSNGNDTAVAGVSDELAFTGSNNQTTALAGAALGLVLMGVAMTFGSRRRRA